MKEINFCAALIVLSLFSVSVHSKEKNNCDDNHSEQIKGSHLKACYQNFERQLEYYRSCPETEPSPKDLAAALNECYVSVMNRTLDKRLSSLKNNDPEEFKKEMKLQALFNELGGAFATDADCSANGFGSYANFGALYVYRAKQAEKINKNSLELPSDLPHTYKIQILKPFAEGLCAMPQGVWKNKKIPDDCVQKALGEIETELKYTHECDAQIEKRKE